MVDRVVEMNYGAGMDEITTGLSSFKYITTRQFVISVVFVTILATFLVLAMLYAHKEATQPVSTDEKEKIFNYWATRSSPTPNHP